MFRVEIEHWIRHKVSSFPGVYSLVREPTIKNKQIMIHDDDRYGRAVVGIKLQTGRWIRRMSPAKVLSKSQFWEVREPDRWICG